uniref:(northern house mosquito) hypothetical protein n=1 Tax=Culex pipiens TaxID=7175 RepID=A0A8D8C5C5_CULPI
MTTTSSNLPPIQRYQKSSEFQSPAMLPRRNHLRPEFTQMLRPRASLVRRCPIATEHRRSDTFPPRQNQTPLKARLRRRRRRRLSKLPPSGTCCKPAWSPLISWSTMKTLLKESWGLLC